MPQQTKIFRVFVSSTFTDMKLERSILQRDAFSKLEKFCEEKGAKFQAVDLRWGVNEESSLNQKTLQICFNEIARCQKISPKPNFLILLGDKYGWQPIPEIILEEEMNALLGVLNGTDKELIQKWYQRDENAIPHEYVLQPKGDALKEYKDWEPIEKEILTALRAAVNQLKFSTGQRIKYFASATHQEIIRGALNPENSDKRPEEHVFAFSRTIARLPEDQSAAGFIDLMDDTLDKKSKAKLDDLKKELSKKLGDDHFKKYDGVWKNGTLHIGEEELQQFNDDILEKLKNIINEQLALVIDKDEINHEVKLHSEFKTRMTEHFEGREDILKIIRKYLDNHSEKRVMSLIGASGTGKSSVMAQAVKVNENKGATLVYRFIGTTSGSSNIMSLLQSVCGEIARAYGIDAKTLAREGDEKAWYDMNGLAEVLKKCLALATEQKPILLFLDSLDQLSDTDNAKALYWLPRELPDHARLVVSTLPELEPALNATYKEPLLVLPVEEAKKILGKWLSSIHRSLTKEQEELVINSFSENKLPIYLKLAFEKARKWHSYDIKHSLKEDVAGIINDYFKDLEFEHDEDFVSNAVCYLLSGRYQGLAENELLEILAFDTDYWHIFLEKNKFHEDDLIKLKAELEKPKDGQRGYMKIPIAVWSRLYLDLEPFLTERDADGVPIITFFHRQFNEVLRERYRLNGSHGGEVAVHSILADYFRMLADPIHDQSWSGHRKRSFTVLPYHLHSAKLTSELATILGDVAFSAAKSSHGGVFDLLNDCDLAIGFFSAGDSEYLRLIQLSSIIHRYAYGLRKYPESSLQQILMGVTALEKPDHNLKYQGISMTEKHRRMGNLRLWSLVPEHRTHGVLQVPIENNQILENYGSTSNGLILRLGGGEWIELSKDFAIIGSGFSTSSYAPIMAIGGNLLILGSANVAQIWSHWPTGYPKIRTFPFPITAASCSMDGRYLAIGCANGLYEVYSLMQTDSAPVVSGHLDKDVIAVCFQSLVAVAFVSSSGTFHRIEFESKTNLSSIDQKISCHLACVAGNETICLMSNSSLLQTYDSQGSLLWEVTLTEQAFCITFAPATNKSKALVVVGLEDGTLQTIDAKIGEFKEVIRVSESAIQQVEMAFGDEFFVCRDLSNLLFLVSRSSLDSVTEFRTWSSFSQVLAVRWNESDKTLQTISRKGDRIIIKKIVSSSESDWRISQLAKIEGPLDDARFLPNGEILTLHRESDESQLWRHSFGHSDSIRSSRLWRRYSFLNSGPIYIDILEISRLGNFYAMASGGGGIGSRQLCRGRIGPMMSWPRWISWPHKINEIALSDSGDVVVITQDTGLENNRPPARILMCRGRTHKLLDDGWGCGIRGQERGLSKALRGISICNSGHRIVAIDTNHDLFCFYFDPKSPDKLPEGRIVLSDVVSCELSSSGYFCAVLQLDQSIRLLQLDEQGNVESLAVLILTSQAHCIALNESDRCLIVSGQNFIQAVSF